MGIGSSGVVNCANTYLGTANYTVADGYVADRTPIVGGNGPAQLNLNFARNEVLDPRITFSRTSNATRVNAQGLIEYAPHNLLTNSENFDNAVWTKTRSSITANVIIAPDGTTTADKFIDDGSIVGQGYISQNYTYTASPYVFSFYAKAGEVTSLRCYLVDSIGIVSASNAIIDLTSGAVTSGSAVVTNAGSGWYRIAVTGVPTAGAGSVRILQPTDTATANGLYIWGAQLNIDSLQPYYTTSVKNLLGYSQNFENAAWVKSNSSIDATPVMGPLGFLGAEKLVESAVAGEHNLSEAIAYTAGTPYTLSVYAKAGERNFIILSFGSGAFGTATRAYFNLTAGTVGTTVNSPTTSIVSIGAGWYRCSITKTATVSAAANTIINETSADGVLSYTGDGTSGIYIFGAQLSDSASLDPYSYNFGAAPTSSAYYGPRFDYDPVTLAPKGLLIEESRANLVTYSEQFNDVSWTKSNATVTANASAAPDGTLTADKLVESAVNGYHYTQNNISVVSATTYTFSVYVKAGEDGFVNIQIGGGLGSSTGVSTNLTTGVQQGYNGASIYSATYIANGWFRISLTVTAVGTGVGSVLIVTSKTLSTNATYTGDGTSGIYIWGAQLEAGAFPTSYIPTTSAQVTRTADNASMVGTNFSSWYNQSEGTVATEYDIVSTTGTFAACSLNDNTNTNAIQTYYNAANAQYQVLAASSNQVQLLAASSTNIKTAFSYKLNDFAVSFNAGVALTDTSGVVPTVNQLRLGAIASGAAYLNGHLKSFKFFSKRFINTYLQSLTQ